MQDFLVVDTLVKLASLTSSRCAVDGVFERDTSSHDPDHEMTILLVPL